MRTIHQLGLYRMAKGGRILPVGVYGEDRENESRSCIQRAFPGQYVPRPMGGPYAVSDNRKVGENMSPPRPETAYKCRVRSL